MKKNIKELIEKYQEIINSPQNERNKQYWDRVYGWDRDMWRGIPKKSCGIPFTIAPDNSFWANILKTDLREYYSNPETYLETQLKIRIYQYNNFDDNTYFTDELFIWFGVITELSYFGAKTIFYPNREGWIEGNVISEYEDLDKLKPPDFYKSGLMPRIHKYYEVLNEYADGKLKVMFPEWVRGPFCLAAHLRGFENILMDTICEPEFVHKIMRFMVESNKGWNQERNKFLKTELKSCKLYNDEVGSPTIGPNTYKKFIFPYEKELSDYYGEVAYWHSCGNTTDFIEQINKLTNLRMYHCGPWTSYKKASEVLNKETTIDINLDPQRDVYESDEKLMVEKLKHIIANCKGLTYTIRADAFMPEGNISFVLDNIKRWNKVALRILNKF